MICLEVSLLWQEFLPDHFVCQKKCLCEKDLNIFSGKLLLVCLSRRIRSLIKPLSLIKNSFSTHVQGAGPWEAGQFTLVGLLPRFRITAKYSKLFRRSSWSQEKKEQPFTKATFSFSFFSSSSFSFFSFSLFFFLLSGLFFFSFSLSRSLFLFLFLFLFLSLSLSLSLSPSLSFSFSSFSFSSSSLSLCLSLYLPLYLSLSLFIFLLLFLFLFISLSCFSSSSSSFPLSLTLSLSLSFAFCFSLFLFLFLFLFILLYLYIYTSLGTINLRCKSNAINMLNPTHYKYYNVISFNSLHFL